VAGGTRSSSSRALSEINVTPFVDVMLVLLIIFMISAPMITRGIEVGLPRAASGDTIEEERVTVTVDRLGQFFVDAQPVVDDLLVEQVRQVRTEGSRAVFLEGDAEVPFGRVLEAMDRLRTAGVTNVALVTEPAAPLETPASAER
jgi:biopolymer transport protein TolR